LDRFEAISLRGENIIIIVIVIVIIIIIIIIVVVVIIIIIRIGLLNENTHDSLQL